jgi:DNA-binding transcriptional LysR family regulator
MNEWAEFRHFRYLLTILEKQGFRAAAEELHTSQPNLTVQARQFQENAHVHLLRRSRNGRIRPTEAGVAFISLARFLLELRDEAIDALNAIERGEISSVCFGCTPLVDQTLFRALCDMHKTLLPSALFRPTHGDASQLVEEILSGAVDLALVTLPVSHPELHIEEIRRDRLVVCLREDNAFARKPALLAADLQNNLAILYHPQRHLAAHLRLIELLNSIGVQVGVHSHASHPSEMQALVREGFGMALIREGTLLGDGLTTRPIAGVDWTVDTALIYHRQRHPKTIPILSRKFKQQFGKRLTGDQSARNQPAAQSDIRSTNATRNKPNDGPVQMSLLG